MVIIPFSESVNPEAELLPYTSHKGMCRPERVWFLPGFGLKTGIDFAHFGLDSGMVFEGTQ